MCVLYHVSASSSSPCLFLCIHVELPCVLLMGYVVVFLSALNRGKLAEVMTSYQRFWNFPSSKVFGTKVVPAAAFH